MITDIELYPEFLRLKGKTYDYRIAYSAVQKMFLLPKPDEIHSQLVVSCGHVLAINKMHR